MIIEIILLTIGGICVLVAIKINISLIRDTYFPGKPTPIITFEDILEEMN